MHSPGWHQGLLITHLIINKDVWDRLSPAQQTLMVSVARDHVAGSYADNLRKQGAALQAILDANNRDRDPDNDMVLVEWPQKDLEVLRRVTVKFLDDRGSDSSLDVRDRRDYRVILKALQDYVAENEQYWKKFMRSQL